VIKGFDLKSNLKKTILDSSKPINMKFKLLITLVSMGIFLYSCGGSSSKSESETEAATDETIMEEDNEKGTVGYVELSDPLEENLVAEGRGIFRGKCSKCHSLESETIKGPGWAGITNRRAPEWIMTMILNVNSMTEVDSLAHALLEQAEMQMPDQKLEVDKARSVLEFMRQNDINQTGTKDEGVEVEETEVEG